MEERHRVLGTVGCTGCGEGDSGFQRVRCSGYGVGGTGCEGDKQTLPSARGDTSCNERHHVDKCWRGHRV